MPRRLSSSVLEIYVTLEHTHDTSHAYNVVGIGFDTKSPLRSQPGVSVPLLSGPLRSSVVLCLLPLMPCFSFLNRKGMQA